MKQHSDDHKLSAVMHYINHNEDSRDTCEIFKCKYQPPHRRIKRPVGNYTAKEKEE